MDRQIVYPGQILAETTLLQMTKDAMISMAKLSAAVLGTATVVNGFAVTPTSPASLQVNVAPGEIYSLQNIDGTAFSSLAADTTHQIMKQGIALDAATLTLAAPATSGQSINYLIEATYADADSAPVLLPYYNSASPSTPFSGQGNNGLTQPTARKGTVVLTAKAGVSAATGSQTTPSPDSGNVGLYVVTVAYGQTQIVAGNISQYAGAPLMTSGLLQSIQNNSTTSAKDTGTANTYKVALSPAPSLGDFFVVSFQPANTNTGASTLALNGGTAYPIVGGAHAALQGGEIAANGKVQAMWHAGLSSFVLLDATNGAVQVANATQSQHAVPLGQLTTLVGQVAGSYSGHAFFSANSTLLAAYAGRLVGFTGSSSFTLTLPLSSAVADGAAYHFVNFTNLPQTIAVSGTDYITPPGGSVAITSIMLLPGETVDICGPGGNWDLVGGSVVLRYSSLYGTPGLFSINAGTVASNALTIGYPSQGIEFRSATLTSGLQSTIAAPSGSLTIPSGATLGTVSGQQAILMLLALNVSGTVVPAVVNLAGGVDLSETGLISTTAISSGATSASVVYSAAAQTNVPYRVIGAYYVTESTAGTWATAPTQAIGVGGEAFSALMSAGYGQTLQNVTGSRAVSTTYYNTTPRPIKVRVTGGSSPTVSSSFSLNGTVVQTFTGTGTSGSGTVTFFEEVSPGWSYSFSFAGSMTSCFETR